MEDKSIMRRYFAEFAGTFVLVFGGLGSAVLAGEKIGFLGVSFAFGISLLVMAYTVGPISGCHINPAVTFGMLLVRKINVRTAAFYVVAQIIGAIVASALVLFIASGGAGGYDPAVGGLGANGYGPHSPGQYSMAAAFVTELILTMFLILTVLGSTDVKAPVGFAGIAIGLVLVVINLVGIPVTNCSANPARSIGPAVFVGGWAWQQLWLFIVAPLLGAAAAAGLYMVIREPVEIITTREAEEALPGEQRERSTKPRAV
jgi:aquaporin Z